ncbi:MAG TPA: ATP-dependent Clp protease ATP-binding subunit, partial [Phaeodactylibacter sp.]|nr:ATP-dependent Clp protease ATP-binding subunit [Phaeodactylibacter sp.]
VGPSGVGKTALVWELSRQMSKRKINGEIWETTASTMIKELTGQTGWQDSLALLCSEMAGQNYFLFIRNLMELFEVGQYEGSNVSMADFLRPYINQGALNLITECTEEELAKIQLRSPNYTDVFQIIKLQEPQEDLEDIIVNKVLDLAQAGQIKFELQAIKETIRLNRRFSPYAGFPGKPIRFLESILLNIKSIGKRQTITGKQVIEHFCEEAGMPNFLVDPEIPMDLKAIKTDFKSELFGQDQAVEHVVNLIGSVKTALSRTGKPIASFLFIGPTGVGKTEMAKILAKFTFGSRNRMIRFDMSEYSDPYAITRLTGTNYFTDGVLTSAVRREPFCVLLFDEIEKAHPNFYDLLLQILGEGRLSDSRRQLVNFCSTIIIMTSNIGAAGLMSNRISWRNEMDNELINNHFVNAVQKHFRPELFNRIDQVIPFEPLSKETIRYVIERELAILKKREGIRFRNMDYHITDEAIDYLAEIGFSTKYGARQLQRTLREYLVIPLSKKLNLLEFDEQIIVDVLLKNNEIELCIESDPLSLDLLMEKLDIINQADEASELRRSMCKLMDGYCYLNMRSELDILERERKSL